jgi:hypothetical protein
MPLGFNGKLRREEARPMKRWIGVLVVLTLVGVGAAWAIQSRPDPQVVKVQGLQARLRTSEGLPDAERRALFDEMRNEMEQLPEEIREQLWRAQREEFEDRMLARMKATLAMSGAEQKAALDAQIDEFESRRKEWEARRRERGQQGEKKAGERKSDGRGASRGGTSAEQRDARRKARLDRSTPEQRAVRAEYRKLLEQRRKERGLGPGMRG